MKHSKCTNNPWVPYTTMYLGNHWKPPPTLTLQNQQLRLHSCQAKSNMLPVTTSGKCNNLMPAVYYLTSCNTPKPSLSSKFCLSSFEKKHQLHAILKMSTTSSTTSSRVSDLNIFQLLSFHLMAIRYHHNNYLRMFTFHVLLKLKVINNHSNYFWDLIQ